MFEVRNLHYRSILQIEKLTIEKNALNIVVGESGSGKTTLFKLLTRLYTKDSGTITFNGRDIETIDPLELRRKAVFVGQDPTISGNVMEAVKEAFYFNEQPYPEREEILSYFDLFQLPRELAEKDVAILSAGEKQRVFILRAVMLDTDIILLDEPFANLNFELSRHILSYFSTILIEKRKKTIVLISHSPELNRLFPCHLIALKDGRIIDERNC